MKLNNYTIIARFFPAIITSFPILAISFYLLDINEIEQFLKFILGIKIITSISVSVIIVFCFAMLIRSLSKKLEKKYFQGNNGFPTTYLMLYAHEEFTNAYKTKYRKKVKKYFDLKLPNKENEQKNIRDSIKKLNEANRQVLNKVRNHGLILKHNIWYGFIRNLVGGAIIAVFCCIIGIILNYFYLKSSTLFIFLSILFIFYLTLFIIKKRLIIQTAEDFAKQVISEFMNLA